MNRRNLAPFSDAEAMLRRHTEDAEEMRSDVEHHRARVNAWEARVYNVRPHRRHLRHADSSALEMAQMTYSSLQQARELYAPLHPEEEEALGVLQFRLRRVGG